VLLVDDHAVVRALRMLLAADPELQSLTKRRTAPKAFALRWSCCPMVLMDISMPDMNGIEARSQSAAPR
jgi:DNA-binding NarL/FixJ family response regulator